MYAVVLRKNGQVVDLLGFVNSEEEYQALGNEFAAANGGAEYLFSQGYTVWKELAF